MYICMYVYLLKLIRLLHITAQSDPVTLLIVILGHSHRINDTYCLYYENLY